MTGKKKNDSNLNSEKQWGGRREGGGFQPKWRNGNSKPVRIPEPLHEAVLAYAHALDEGSPLPQSASESPQPRQALLAPKESAAEDIRQMRLTLEAVRSTLEQWRGELQQHNPKSPRWEKANQLFDALDTHLNTPWL